MSRPSPLYRRLGLTSPLILGILGDVQIGDRAYSISIRRGGSDLSSHSPAICTIKTPDRIYTSPLTREMRVLLATEAGEQIAAATYTTRADIVHRFNGRIGTQDAHDKGDHKGGWTGTTVAGAAWSSLLEHSPDLWTPGSGSTLQNAMFGLFRPSWESRATCTWDGVTAGDRWPTGPHEPLTPADLLRILADRLYLVHDMRRGWLRIRDLERTEALATAAASSVWPLARAHVLAPTDWHQTSSYPTQYRLTHTTPTGTAQIITGQTPDGTTRVEDLDWTDLVTYSEQWRRVYGIRFDSYTWPWRLPSVTVRLDHLISSPRESDRRAAGMLLGLEVGDPVPLAGDWPAVLDGIHLVTSLDEDITPDAWTLRVGLTPYGSAAGQASPPVAPRTWAQAGTRTWDDVPTTWNEGVPA